MDKVCKVSVDESDASVMKMTIAVRCNGGPSMLSIWRQMRPKRKKDEMSFYSMVDRDNSQHHIESVSYPPTFLTEPLPPSSSST